VQVLAPLVGTRRCSCTIYGSCLTMQTMENVGCRLAYRAQIAKKPDHNLSIQIRLSAELALIDGRTSTAYWLGGGLGLELASSVLASVQHSK